MDLNALIGQFFDEKGQIALPPHLTLAGLSEHVYGMEKQAGVPDRPVLRQWVYSEDPNGVPRDFTRSQVNTRIKVVAARLQQVGAMGDRVAILAGNSPEYIFGFMGAMYAGMTPLPLYDPNEPGHTDHLRAVFGDSNPSIVLTNNVSAAAVRKYFADRPSAERPRVISIDSLPDSLAASWVNPLETEAGQAAAANLQGAPIDQPAFLQYTSGSTRTPAGVLLTNRSIMTNVLQIFAAVQLKHPSRIVSWLPMHHDMGIILASFVTIMGLNFEIMTPRDFVQQPKRWVRQISRQPMDENFAATYSVVPNFALELAARYGAPEAGEELDFSNVDGIVIGSEPVTETAVESFLEVFSTLNLKREALRPSYGLAEASLMVSTPQVGERPLISHFDREQLAAGKAVISEKSADTVAFASNGQTVPVQFLTIVDPETRAELGDAQIGEIWLHGENMAAGYLGREDETASTFHNTLGERLAEGSRVAGAPDDNNWMATGDLATIVDGQLYITGRLKDLIVVAGRNHYPQDIEGTVQEASEHVRPDSVAAFSVEGDNTEQLVLLIERADNADPSGDEAATEVVRTAVSKNHGLTPDIIRWFGANEINRTSSGKIARRVAKKHFEV
ncbi:FadD32-like long-chain-fatty-acid--AMP ligase [Corynebacterium striatum]